MIQFKTPRFHPALALTPQGDCDLAPPLVTHQIADSCMSAINAKQIESALTKMFGRKLKNPVTAVHDKSVAMTYYNRTIYDKRLRPMFGESKPVRVYISIRVASINDISELDSNYKLTIYFQQQWVDERLDYSDIVKATDCPLTLDSRVVDQIWIPDTYFTDRDSFIHDVTTKNRLVRLWPNGTVLFGMRLTLELGCPLHTNLQKYPLDDQKCTLEAESYGYNDINVKYCADPRSMHEIEEIKKLRLPQFVVTNATLDRKTAKFTSGNYDRMVLTISLSRNIGYFILQTYIPCSLITILSWVSFWINHEATAARVALGVTTVLTMTTISTNVRAALPKVNYIKALDVYTYVSFFFTFFGLIEYAVVNHMFCKIKQRQAKQRKRAILKRQEMIRRNKEYSKAMQNTMQNTGEVIRPDKSFTLLKAFNLGEVLQKYLVRIPDMKDVSVIDKYARVFFPSSFLFFNLWYFMYYNYWY